MLRRGGPPDDTTLLIRATPASVDEATVDIAEDALESAAVYEVAARPQRILSAGAGIRPARPTSAAAMSGAAPTR